MPTQTTAFNLLRRRLAVNGLRAAVAEGKVRLVTMIGTSLVVALFVLALSYFGFHELFRARVPVKGLIVGGLFDLMFFTLGGMLTFSTGIILFASLFTAPEARFLLTTPATADRIFAVKFQQAVAFSSWAFLVLGLPILVAYGLVAGVPWYFYPLLPLYLLGFVLLPGGFSALVMLLLCRVLPRNRKQTMVLLSLALLMLVGAWAVQTLRQLGRTARAGGNKNEVESLLGQFQLVRSPLAPSHWMTNGLMAAARREPIDALVPLALLWSNGLMMYLVAALTARVLYRPAYDRLAGGGRGRKVYRSSVLDRAMETLVFYLPAPTRVLVVKDFRSFRRDPTQWALLALFTVLLLLAASNFRQYARADLARLDKYAVSLVNLSAMCVFLCAGLSRFIFPLISLEGRKFWVLGLMPVSRDQILWGKFAFAATGSGLVVLALIAISDAILGLPVEVVAVHCLTVLVTALGLSGLNVGLGAYMPNFRETDPSKVVVGFGGTVNMVVGLMFLLLVVATMAVPIHVAGLRPALTDAVGREFPPWAFAGLPVGLLLGVLAVALPLRAGSRALRATEF